MLKAATRLLEPDPAYTKGGPFGGVTLEELHLDVGKYALPPDAPEGVQRSYDAARHAYVYSYFSYDLLTPGVSQLFACLELALRNRLGLSWDRKSRAPGLFDMLTEAKKRGFISSDVSALHKLRNVFQHGTDSIIDPNTFLGLLERVTSLTWELYGPVARV